MEKIFTEYAIKRTISGRLYVLWDVTDKSQVKKSIKSAKSKFGISATKLRKFRTGEIEVWKR